MIKKILVSLFAIVALLGCKQSNTAKKQFNGYVIWEESYTTFTDCNTGKEYWLEDKTGEVTAKFKQIAKEPYQQVFFTFEADLLPPATMGAAASFNNIMEVKKVVSAATKPDTGTCSMTMKKPVFDCMGEAPLWAITFNEQDIKFTSVFPNDTLVFFGMAEPQLHDSAGVGKVFYYYIQNENFQNIQLIITEQPCKNPQGHVSRFSAKALFGGNVYNGCAKIKITTDEQNPNPTDNTGPIGSL